MTEGETMALLREQHMRCDADQGLVMQVQDAHPEHHPEAQDALLSGQFGSAMA